MFLEARVPELVCRPRLTEQPVSVGIVQEGHQPPGELSGQRKAGFRYKVLTPHRGGQSGIPIGQSESKSECESVEHSTARTGVEPHRNS